jgi:DNA topoisomerase-2
VTFKPDLEKFKMTYLEEDVVALMKKRVVDMAGCLGKAVKVELNGKLIRMKSFRDYADLYLKSAEKSRPVPLPRFAPKNIVGRVTVFWLFPLFYNCCTNLIFVIIRIHAKVGERWEICVSLSDGQFQQVSRVSFRSILTRIFFNDFVPLILNLFIPGQLC